MLSKEQLELARNLGVKLILYDVERNKDIVKAAKEKLQQVERHLIGSLRHLRKERGISQAKIANAAGVTVAYVSQAENNKAPLSEKLKEVYLNLILKEGAE